MTLVNDESLSGNETGQGLLTYEYNDVEMYVALPSLL